MQELPKAIALQWDSISVQFLCPHCLYSHRHGIGAESSSDRTGSLAELSAAGIQRQSHCVHGGQYLVVFPGCDDPETSDYGWEVDRATNNVVAMNARGAVPISVYGEWESRTLLPEHEALHHLAHTVDDDDSDEDELRHAMGGLDLGSDTAESARQMPDMTVEETTLDEDGDTGVLVSAAHERGLETVRWLHQNGDNILKANHYGRTPLMEAALWGRLDIVQYLTRQEVDIKARDGKRMQAVDLTAYTPRNTRGRVQRANNFYRERNDADEQRERIEALLKRLAPSRAEIRVRLQRRAFFGRTPDGKLEVYRPQVLLEPPPGQYGPHLAFATLDRGPNYPYIYAMRGNSHTGWPNLLDNEIWTDKANDLRASLGLPRDRQLVSHVEPQLLAYVINRHTLEVLDQQDTDEDLEEEDTDDLSRLRPVMPLYAIRPVITVSKKDLCPHCQDLFERFKQEYPDIRMRFECVGDAAMEPLHIRE